MWSIAPSLIPALSHALVPAQRDMRIFATSVSSWKIVAQACLINQLNRQPPIPFNAPDNHDSLYGARLSSLRGNSSRPVLRTDSEDTNVTGRWLYMTYL
jgi:hypothetical protein